MNNSGKIHLTMAKVVFAFTAYIIFTKINIYYSPIILILLFQPYIINYISNNILKALLKVIFVVITAILIILVPWCYIPAVMVLYLQPYVLSGLLEEINK